MRSTPLRSALVEAGLDGLVVDRFGLAGLIGRAASTITVDRCRRPETLPPACIPPGTRRPLWLVSDVLAWLAVHREPTPTPAPRSPGRPRKTRAGGAK